MKLQVSAGAYAEWRFFTNVPPRCVNVPNYFTNTLRALQQERKRGV